MSLLLPSARVFQQARGPHAGRPRGVGRRLRWFERLLPPGLSFEQLEELPATAQPVVWIDDPGGGLGLAELANPLEGAPASGDAAVPPREPKPAFAPRRWVGATGEQERGQPGQPARGRDDQRRARTIVRRPRAGVATLVEDQPFGAGHEVWLAHASAANLHEEGGIVHGRGTVYERLRHGAPTLDQRFDSCCSEVLVVLTRDGYRVVQRLVVIQERLPVGDERLPWGM